MCENLKSKENDASTLEFVSIKSKNYLQMFRDFLLEESTAVPKTASGIMRWSYK